MALQPLPGFQPFPIHHCISGSLRRIYLFNGYPISEEMLLGLGGGVGFVYWQMRGLPPFVGGRVGINGQFERAIGQRTGVGVQVHHSASAGRAEEALVQLLAAGRPVMLLADMGLLPYLDLGTRGYHFGGHGVVACGYDPQTGQVLLADRDDSFHPISLEQLARARGSPYRPFPPRNTWYTFDFSGKKPIAAMEVYRAIAEQARGMIEPSRGNFGLAGIRKAAQSVARWGRFLDEAALRTALFNLFAYIDASGGTGGGLFRTMFARFLSQAAALTGDAGLAELTPTFHGASDRWQAIALAARHGATAARPAGVLPEIAAILQELAALEEEAWQHLRIRATSCIIRGK